MRGSLMLRFGGLIVLVLGFTACKGDPVKCEKACRKGATLMFPKMIEAEIAKECAALPDKDPASPECEAIRKRKLTERAARIDKGLQLCVNQCVSANNEDQMDCLLAAKTGDEATKCTADD
ncbi:MAG: hypothetical protein AB7P03_29410 [Kofleriaceae bacterium]